jgi:hypothetical protein
MAEGRSGSRVTDDATAGVLRLAVVRDLRTIDRLLDALATPEEGPVLLRRLETLGGLLSPIEVSGLSLPELREVKQSGKRGVSGSAGEEEQLVGSWRYIVAVAGGLAVHGENISSSGARELRPILLDLAELTGHGWCDLFRSAAERLIDRGE